MGWYTSKGTFAADESTFPELPKSWRRVWQKDFRIIARFRKGPPKSTRSTLMSFDLRVCPKEQKKVTLKFGVE